MNKYYFYHITYYRISDGAIHGVAMGHVYRRFFFSPTQAYDAVKAEAIRGCPRGATWSIDTIHRNK